MKLAFGLPAAIVGCVLATAALAQDKKEIRLAHHMPLQNHMHTSAEQLAKYFNDRSKDTQIKVFGGGQLYTERALVQSVETGGVEIAFTTASWWGGTTPSIHVLNAPMLLTSYTKAHAAVTGKMGKALETELEKNDVKIIGWIDSGIDAALVNTVKPIKTIEDFKGMRIRTSYPMSAALFTALGAGSVVMSSSEVYMALQRGTFDGTHTGAPSVTDRKWIEVTKFATRMPLLFSSHPVAVNRAVWDKLSPENQKLLLEAGKVAGEASRKRAEDAENASWAQIEKAMPTIRLDPDASKKLEEIADRVSTEYLKKNAGETGIRIYNLAKEDIKNVK